MNKRISFGLAKTSNLASPAHRASVTTGNNQVTAEDGRLLECFTGEVYASALACTAILSCFNAIKLDREILIPADLRRCMPLSPMTFTAVNASEIADLLQDETRSSLSGYQYYLEAGKRSLSAQLESDRSTLAIDFQTLRSLLQPFNTASSFSLLMIKDLQRVHATIETGKKWSAALRTLGVDLEGAMHGASPYFKNGKFEVPVMSEGKRAGMAAPELALPDARMSA